MKELLVPIKKWLGRKDSNLRMPDPKTGALPLGYAPIKPLETNRKQLITLFQVHRDIHREK